MSRPLSSRISLVTALPALLAVVCLGCYVLMVRLHDIREHSFDLQRLVVESYSARLQAQAQAPLTTHQELLRALLEEPDVRAATLHHADNQRQVHAGPRMRPLADANAPMLSPRLETGAGWRWSTPVAQTGYTLEVEFSNYRQHIELLRTLLMLLFAAIAIIGITTLISIRFGRAFSVPMQHLLNTLESLKSGQLDARTHVGGPPELVRLQNALNQMASQLQEGHRELVQNMEQATEDLRESLETLEVQNIELDMARKEAQQASRIKSEFLANMSHEIRTPMNSIIGFTRSLLRQETNPQTLDALTTIRKSSEALLSIINDILDFSKIEAGKLSLDETPVCLQDVIEDVQTMLSPLAQEKNLEQATIIYNDFPRHVLSDPLRLRQIITNLVSNAIKFTDQGSVVVRGMLEEHRGKDAILKITVTDTGPGLTEEQSRHIFNAFTQGDASVSRREGGTGLGLTICRRIVESMGGEIGVDSERGQGSSFWFTFRAPVHQELDNDEDDLQGRRILLVESEEHSGLSLFHMLAGWNSDITPVQQFSPVGLDISSFHAAVIGLPAKPTPEQRQELEALLAEVEYQDIPVVIFSHQSDAFRAQISALGERCRLLGKPATRKRLLQALKELLHLGTGDIAQRPRQRFRGTAMVVDDHPGNLKLAGLLLSEHGLETVLCQGGREALDTLRQGTAVDIVFMDIQMPGMDGIETTRRLNQLFAEDTLARVPIIALTAHALASEKDQLLAAGLDDYLTKPLDEKQLEYVLSRWLRQSVSAARPVASSTAVAASAELLDYPLALKRCAHRHELVLDMHRQLLATLPQDHEQLNRYYVQADTQGMLETVHRLHGATRYCGIPLLELAAGRLETLLKQTPEAVEVDLALDELVRVIRQVLDQDILSMIANASA